MFNSAHHLNPWTPQDLISNSPYCLQYNSGDVSLENLELEQPIIPQLIFFFILITCLLDIVFTVWGEILSGSLVGLKGLWGMGIGGKVREAT